MNKTRIFARLFHCFHIFKVELVRGIVSLGIPEARMPPSSISESKILQFKPLELTIREFKFAAVISAMS